jgi:hypothetical protein
MKKLTITQWIAFGFAVIGFVVSTLEQFGVAARIIGGIASIASNAKIIYDLYLSFNVNNMNEFAEYSARNQTANKRLNNQASAIEDWKRYKK